MLLSTAAGVRWLLLACGSSLWLPAATFGIVSLRGIVVCSSSSDCSRPRWSHGDCAAGQRGGRGECLTRLDGDGSKLVCAWLKLICPVLPAGWPGVRRRRTERGASVNRLPVPCGVRSLGGGDEAPATDAAEFNVFSEISPRASLRSSVNSSAFLAEAAEHELERLSRCAPLLSRDDRGGRSPSGDLDGDVPPCMLSSGCFTFLRTPPPSSACWRLPHPRRAA